MSDNWYLTWSMKGISDATWGGPVDFEMNEYPPKVDLREEAHLPAAQLLPSLADYQGSKWNLGSDYETPYGPDFTMASPEAHEHVGERLGKFVHDRRATHPGETIVFVSHGGPSAALFEFLVGHAPPKKFGFTAIAVLEQVDGEFVPHLEGSTSHLQAADDLGLNLAGV